MNRLERIQAIKADVWIEFEKANNPNALAALYRVIEEIEDHIVKTEFRGSLKLGK